MRTTKAKLLPILLLVSFAACDLVSDPVSLNVRFEPAHVLNPDGTCTVQFVAQAAGIGTLFWERVTIRSGNTVLEDLVGAETAQFWGADRIRAGRSQPSAPFTAPNAARDIRIEVAFRSEGQSLRRTTLAPRCE